MCHIKMRSLFSCVIALFIVFLKFTDCQIDGDLKLVNGQDDKDGTLLVFRGYGWGTICDDHWTESEANVACRQMGMGVAIEHHRSNYFGTYGRDYMMDDVVCRGNETKLIQCQYSGWGNHDCGSNEAVGVRCSKKPDNTIKKKKDPFISAYTKEELTAMKNGKFTEVLERQVNNSYSAVIQKGNEKLLICPDYFNAMVVNIICRKHFNKLAAKVIKVDKATSDYASAKFGVKVHKCYGNETSLSECETYYKRSGVKCDSDKIILFECTEGSSDVQTDYLETERSSYLAKVQIYHLRCAITENCLPSVIHNIMDRYPNTYQWMTRSLLRFSSIIENIGTKDFLPVSAPCEWEWHGCHQHYHSMKVFAKYEVFSLDGRRVAEGLKASFCLEDNLCNIKATPKFRCSSSLEYFGVQGISPGCKDTYFHDYDCQWIDITDLKIGNYIFQIIINPDYIVPESNFFNNGLSCNMFYRGYNAVLRSCAWKHPNDLLQ